MVCFTISLISEFIQPAYLPTSLIDDGKRAEIFGWGEWSSTSDLSEVLRSVTLKIISKYDCTNDWNVDVEFDFICTESGNGKGMCSVRHLNMNFHYPS